MVCSLRTGLVALLLLALPWVTRLRRAELFHPDELWLAPVLAVTGPNDPHPTCLLRHCPVIGAECMLDKLCRETAICNAKCQGKPNELACDLLCQLTTGYNSTKYKQMLQCMNEHHCLPVTPGSDGVCLSPTPSKAGHVLTDMKQMTGKWYILRGMNCGQKGWPAGFDAFPCQRDDFVLEDGKWVDHIAYCGGNVSKTQECQTQVVNTRADVYISQPGVMTHNYTDAPLLPQNEEWRVLSWPDQGDWMLYIYCGYTPTGAYAGGSVVTRGKNLMSEIPAQYEQEFRAVTREYGFDYDAMCVSDVTQCAT